MAAETSTERCTWCGNSVSSEDGFRAYEPAGSRAAVFCRLEHLVPWSIQGPKWGAGDPPEPEPADIGAERCALCDAELGEVHILLVRHREGFRIPDRFCSLDHMVEWAKRGGRWR